MDVAPRDNDAPRPTTATERALNPPDILPHFFLCALPDPDDIPDNPGTGPAAGVLRGAGRGGRAYVLLGWGGVALERAEGVLKRLQVPRLRRMTILLGTPLERIPKLRGEFVTRFDLNPHGLEGGV